MAYKHGWSGTRVYKAWKSMNDRCRCQTHHAWVRYGGRGIEVCDHWRTFVNFLADMGVPPAGLSLERANNEGHYEPGNCVWASRKEQQNNLRSNVKFTLNGKTQTLQQWSEECGVKYQTLYSRLFNLGWAFELAINCTVKKAA